jgi:biopolymer transport protein ExbB/TolQ
MQVTDVLNSLSAISTYVIVGAFAVHLFVFFVLWLWSRRDLKTMASSLADFTRDLKNRSVLDSTSHLSEQIEAFLADVNEVLDHPSRRADRDALLHRVNILDEKRKYLDSLFFETSYNLSRTMIEAYPLAGVLGTILGIGAALAGDSAGAATTVGDIVGRFGDAIWSTFAGLIAAIVLMFINGFLEPSFNRLSENRLHVRETVRRVKRELSFSRAGAE